MEERSTKTLALILMLFVFSIQPVFADGGEEVNKELGWLAIGAGALATLPFNAYNFLRRFITAFIPDARDISRKLALIYKPALHFHIAVNSAGTLAAFSHGFALIRYLDPISLSLTVVIAAVMVSGYFLMLVSNRYSKALNKVIHTQIVITALLIVLIILHVITAED